MLQFGGQCYSWLKPSLMVSIKMRCGSVVGPLCRDIKELINFAIQEIYRHKKHWSQNVKLNFLVTEFVKICCSSQGVKN